MNKRFSKEFNFSRLPVFSRLRLYKISHSMVVGETIHQRRLEVKVDGENFHTLADLLALVHFCGFLIQHLVTSLAKAQNGCTIDSQF